MAGAPEPLAHIPAATANRWRITIFDVRMGLAVWLITEIVAIVGTVFGWALVRPRAERAPTLIAAFTRWDGERYASIIEKGYYYTENDFSNIAFFPLYPAIAQLIHRGIGIDSRLALLVVAQLFLVLAFIVLHAYARNRFSEQRPAFACSLLLIVALFPSAFFFRMAYSESLFVFLFVLFLFTIEGRRSLLLPAILAGLATATRPVGVALIPVIMIESWRRSSSAKQFAARSLVLLPLSCSGLIAFILFQWWAFDDPLSFLKAQKTWQAYRDVAWSEKLRALLLLEPIWGTVLSSSKHCDTADMAWGIPLLGLSALNAAFFVSGVILVVLGGCRRWLTRTELIASAGLLLIPYMTRGYDSYFLSFARFTAVVVPMYIPLAMLAQRLPQLLMVALLTISACILTVICALFAADYFLI